MAILILEDNPDINQILTSLFQKEGYTVFSYDNVFDALEGFKSHNIQCVLTDLMLPIMSGESFIKKIREDFYGLIIAITAKSGEEDKLNVLSIGADDYIVKPFNKKEVLIKVNNYFLKLNRRNQISSLNNGEFKYNHKNNSLIVNGHPITLTSIEFLTLGVLMKSLNNIVTRNQIIEQVYHNDLDVFDRVIDGQIKKIRKKIKQHTDVEFIKTVYGLGYKLEGEIDE